MTVATGYLTAAYASSFASIGSARLMPKSRGWILVRDIPGEVCRDATSCYPFYACQSWGSLGVDLAELDRSVVSVAIVTDPFGDFDLPSLQRSFDSVRPFKEHFVVDLAAEEGTAPTAHHRYYSRRALRSASVEEASDPAAFSELWGDLYEHLIERRGVKGITAFSRAALTKQLEVPGAVLLRAVRDERTVAAHLWYLQGEVAYSHLQASTPEGYEIAAAYALYASAIEMLSDRVRWLALGGTPGLDGDQGHGLRSFKRGWSTGTRTVYLCTRILDSEMYDRLVERRDARGAAYFPAYRTGEFV